ncbi:MAG: hypothetical protein RLZZ15_298 [Verrucomicrobiota bacterium]
MPANSLASSIAQVGHGLRQAAAGTGLDPIHAATTALENAALDAGHPLLAGAAICLQQWLPFAGTNPASGHDWTTLADWWEAYAPDLLAAPGTPALEDAWLALQEVLALPAGMGTADAAAPAGELPASLDPVADDAAAADFLADMGGDADPVEPIAPARKPAPAPKPSSRKKAPAAKPAPLPSAAPLAADSTPPLRAAAPSSADDEVPPEMIEIFNLEAAEGFVDMERSVLAWERAPATRDHLHNVYRLAHSVKGAANAVGIRAVGRVLHGLEDLLEDRMEGRSALAPALVTQLVLSVVDQLRTALNAQTVITPAWNAEADALIASIATARAAAPAAVPVAEVAPVAAEISAATPVVEIGAGAELAPIVEPVATAAVAPVVEIAPEIAPEIAAEIPAEVTADSAALVPAIVAPDAEILAAPVVAVAPAAPARAATTTPFAELAKAKTDTRLAAVAAEPTLAREHNSVRVDARELDGLMNLVGDLIVNRNRLNAKLAQVVNLRSELGRARERLLGVVGDFNSRNEFTARRVTGPTPAVKTGFSDNELDRYDDFNILSRSLVEIAADAEQVIVQIDEQFGSFSEETVSFTAVTRRLQEEVARVRMVPVDLLYRRLQRSVRDAAHTEAKSVDYLAEGGDTRIDKLISDAIYTPLLHLVRNAVAHGIESPAARLAAGKPEAGRLSIRSRAEAGRVVLEVTDDGAGLDRARILAKARERGLVKPGAADPDDAILTEFIFLPGFSTAAVTTDVAGRGLGLDVVRSELARLGGTVSVQTTAGRGATFLVTLPLTLAINQAMLVESAGRVYAVPFNFVERVLEAPAAAVSRTGGEEMLVLPGVAPLPLLRLDQRLGWPTRGSAAIAVVLRVGDQRRALLVDRIRSKLDIVVKPLGPILGRHPCFTGATLGADGGVVFILDVPALVSGFRATTAAAPIAAEVVATATRILVVDDSLSIRRIVANHLERAGYAVDTAVDGAEALERLRATSYAMVFSDLEMPRLNGFELTAEIRRQPALAGLPVVILTSRDAEKHRAHATAAGANDYLIKPAGREQIVELARRHAGAPVAAVAA